MVYEDACKTFLSLSSLFNDDQNLNHQNSQQNKNKLLLSLKFDHELPSLSLALPPNEKKEKAPYRSQASNSRSGMSSYSNSSVKRDREVISQEEFEVERDCRVRKKLRLIKQLSSILEDSFEEHGTLNPKLKEELAKQLSLRPRQVEVWYQNRRARTKFKQTEVQYELMKKCLEKLTDENKRLQKELQELKAMKATAPFYLQLPTTTRTLCPSCERIGNSNDIPGNSHFPKANPHFYNNCTNSYAAC